MQYANKCPQTRKRIQLEKSETNGSHESLKKLTLSISGKKERDSIQTCLTAVTHLSQTSVSYPHSDVRKYIKYTSMKFHCPLDTNTNSTRHKFHCPLDTNYNSMFSFNKLVLRIYYVVGADKLTLLILY